MHFVYKIMIHNEMMQNIVRAEKKPKLKYNIKNTCSIKFYLKTKKCNQNYLKNPRLAQILYRPNSKHSHVLICLSSCLPSNITVFKSDYS